MKLSIVRVFAIFVSAAALLLGCNNIFNPSGEGDVDDSSTDGKISYVNSLIYSEKYDDAISEINKILAGDSTVSEAYYLKCKALVRKNNITLQIFADIGLIFLDTANTEDANEVPGGIDDVTSNPIIDMATKLNEIVGDSSDFLTVMDSLDHIISVWMPRDSLTRLFVAMKALDNPIAYEVPLIEATQEPDSSLYNFIQLYNNADSLVTFPRSDLKENAAQLKITRLVSDQITKYSKVLDLIPDFDDLANLVEGVTAGELDISIIGDMDSAATDTAYRNELNEKIANAQASMDQIDISSFLGDFTGDSETDDNDSLAKEAQNADVDAFADILIFYRIQDQIDNDGDGCIDEEIRDDKDNDGDGYVDEDVRLIDFDLFDNDQNGSMDLLDGNEGIASADTSLTWLGYVYDVDSNAVKTDFWGDSALVKEFKIRAATDSLKEIPLETLQLYMGGCWNNYTTR
ncbi:MAG: hypothetical protein OCD01_15510 [Fibrobacterales bacterium]